MAKSHRVGFAIVSSVITSKSPFLAPALLPRSRALPCARAHARRVLWRAATPPAELSRAERFAPPSLVVVASVLVGSSTRENAARSASVFVASARENAPRQGLPLSRLDVDARPIVILWNLLIARPTARRLISTRLLVPKLARRLLLSSAAPSVNEPSPPRSVMPSAQIRLPPSAKTDVLLLPRRIRQCARQPAEDAQRISATVSART